MSDAQVSRLVGTTKPTIVAVRDRTHWNIQQLKPADPISLGLCSQQDLDEAITRARHRGRLDRERTGAKATAPEDAADAMAETAPAAEPVAEAPDPAS